MSHATQFERRRKAASAWEDSIPERADAIAKRICAEAKAGWPEPSEDDLAEGRMLGISVEQTREDFIKGQFSKFTT